MLRSDKDDLKDNLVEAEEVGKIVKNYAGGPARIAIEDGSADFIASELQAEVQRERIIEVAEADLNRIDPNTEQALVDRVRRIIPEVAIPLKRSSTKMDVELG